MGKKIFLDVDIDGSRDAFKRATEFVATSSIKYGLSTDDVTKLGGRSFRRRRPPARPPPARAAIFATMYLQSRREGDQGTARAIRG